MSLYLLVVLLGEVLIERTSGFRSTLCSSVDNTCCLFGRNKVFCVHLSHQCLILCDTVLDLFKSKSGELVFHRRDIDS